MKNILLICSCRQIQLNISWCRAIVIVKSNDYSVYDDILFLEDRWGPHSIDRFACDYNTKLPTFNSRFLQPGTEAVDAFTQDWSSENIWLVLPTTLVGRVFSHMSDCKAVAYFGPLQCSDGAHFNFFVRDWLFLSKNRICSLRVKQRTNCSEPRHSSHDVWRFVLILRVTVVALL